MAKTKEKVVRRCAWTGCKEDISHRGNRAMFCEEHQKENRRNQDRSRRVPAKGKRQVNGDASQWTAASKSTRMDSVAQMRMLPIKALEPSQSRAQTLRRGRFDDAAIEELAASVRSVGIVEPLVVRADESTADRWQIVAGERRWLAAQRAGLNEVPCVVREFDDEQAAIVQLIENLQRVDVHALDEAAGFSALVREHGWDVKRLAAEIGRSRSHVYGRLALLKLSADCQQALSEGAISATVARALSSVPAVLQEQALDAVLGEQQHEDTLLTSRRALDLIETLFRRRLAGSVDFDPDDAALIAAWDDDGGTARAMACTQCPWNTSVNRSLGGAAAMCCQPSCWDGKAKETAELRVKNAALAVVRAADPRDFDGATGHPARSRFVVADGWAGDSLRAELKEAGKKPPRAKLFVVEDEERLSRGGNRVTRVYDRKDLPKLPKPPDPHEKWRRQQREKRERVAAARERVLRSDCLEVSGADAHDAALTDLLSPARARLVLLFVVSELRREAWQNTVNRLEGRWPGVSDRRVSIASLCRSDLDLATLAADLVFENARQHEDGDAAEQFAAAWEAA